MNKIKNMDSFLNEAKANPILTNLEKERVYGKMDTPMLMKKMLEDLDIPGVRKQAILKILTISFITSFIPFVDIKKESQAKER